MSHHGRYAVEPSGPTGTAYPAATGWRRLLILDGSLVDFAARGFRTRPERTRRVLELAAGTFLDGYNRELATPDRHPPDLADVPPDLRGFAAEGAAMGACLLDVLRPGGRRFAALLARYGDSHGYLLYVGVGWTMAKLRGAGRGVLERAATDSLGRWLADDGWGFCRGFFATEAGLRPWYTHRGRCGTRCAIRYQGLGRSLWFRDCGSPAALARRMAWLPEGHQADVWSGVALAATYAGGVHEDTYPRLREAAGRHGDAVAQGAAFGAEAWRRCGHVPAQARAAVTALAGVSVEEAAAWTVQARAGLDHPAAGPGDYQRWRSRIRRHAAQATVS